MKEIELSAIANCISIRKPSIVDEGVMASGVSIDSRQVLHGDIFFAIRGDNHDGHKYIKQALSNGAIAAVVDLNYECNEIDKGKHIEVEDTLEALQALARWYVKELGVKVIGITGSNGKTSTKDFINAVLSEKYSVCETKGNYNNHIGLPLTILSAEAHSEILVLEMGMNHTGEIDFLCNIADPTYGIITNVGRAHIENLGSVEAIAKEKGALARYLPKTGSLFVPSSCNYLNYFKKETEANFIRVGGEQSSVKANNIRTENEKSIFDLSIEGQITQKVSLRVLGSHMIENSLLAAAVGNNMGLTIEEISKGLNNADLSGGRLKVEEKGGVKFIDDTYNANPDSMLAALRTLDEIKDFRKKYAILGEMAELGSFEEEGCQNISDYISSTNIHPILVGNNILYSKLAEAGVSVNRFEEKKTAINWLNAHIKKGDVLLFKGSRSAQMEEVLRGVEIKHIK